MSLSSKIGMDIKKFMLKTYLRDHIVLCNRCNDGKHDNIYKFVGNLEMTWTRKKSPSGNNFHGKKNFIDKKDNVKTETKGSNGKCFGCGETEHYKNNCPKSGGRVKKNNNPVENTKRVEQLENMNKKSLEKKHSGELVRRTNDLENVTVISDLKLNLVEQIPVVDLVDTENTKCIILRSTADLIGISCDFLHSKTYSLANNSSWRVLGEVEVQFKKLVKVL
uniref:CCHC-type domain-containing protein n=1 Tax=Strongyloides venezuelensis TaxID=75913 RepID=A0A0K0G2D9_STRVS